MGERHREWHAQLASTQDRAILLAREGAPSRTVVVAARQTGGRGRLDHGWSSPEGGVYASWVGEDLADAGLLVPLALGAGLQDRFERRWGIRCALKWPNDLLWSGSSGPPRKLAGLLVERVAIGASHRMVVGVGVNVRARSESFPPELRDTIVQLAELVRPTPTLEEVESAVLDRVEEVMSDLASPHGRTRWWMHGREVLYGRGRPIRIDGVPVGRLLDLEPSGALRVSTPDGERAFVVGEIAFEDTP
jgi:BirA family transcriptional regulator, biotin operon repressor / biotin---[acetyl-CoA-carboxylase] ligase